MNDNEKLIEEAAKAMFLRQNPRSSWEMIPSNDMHRADWMSDARTAFAVFENAHTPTDDERGALVAILEAPLTEESRGRTFSEMLADVILVRFGFRRSEAPEPSAERDGVKGLALDLLDEMNAAPASIHYSDYTQLHNLISDLAGPGALAAELQGEPSYAQVYAALDAWLKAKTRGIPEPNLAAMRAALIAAGGAR